MRPVPTNADDLDTASARREAPARRGESPPSLALFLSEPGRSALDLATMSLATPLLRRAPHGDGHGVLVLPGLGATDSSTVVLRRFLHRLGYQAWGWRLGRNMGPTSKVVDGMQASLDQLVERSGGPVSVIGWSLGGIFARELSRREKSPVRQVITLGSPFAMTAADRTRADRMYRRREHLHVAESRRADRREIARPVPAPSTAVYSRRDGIVSWRTCVQQEGPQSENIEVRCSHLGFGHDPATLWVVADRLAQPDEWRPFRVPSRLRLLYPRSSPAGDRS